MYKRSVWSGGGPGQIFLYGTFSTTCHLSYIFSKDYENNDAQFEAGGASPTVSPTSGEEGARLLLSPAMR